MGPDERALLLEAFDSNWIAPLGPHVDAFERELAAATGTAHCAALSSGTAGLHLGLILLGVEPGDEVFVSTLTFSATANAVRYVGATPVFVDADPTTWTMDPLLLEQALEQRARSGRLPKAVITVDLYGQCCDYERIGAACARFDVPMLQDAAEALGATHSDQPAGSQGVLGVLSFNGNKIITTSGGGALVSDRGDWIEHARFLSTQARDPFPHYEHSTVGYNYRLSNLLAAVGRGQLRHLDQRVAARRANFASYREGLGDLPGWSFMPEAPYGTASRWLTCALIDPARSGAPREAVRLALAAADIEARPVWKPMHLQPVFRDCLVFGGSVAERLFDFGLCLPSGSSMTGADRERVVSIVRSARADVA
ncbi:MAG: aminotransferase class I/II-fold pyridoxal phosphate-dependent enzyme [Polyangiaceae bacterium]|nr:aminotransferase class I/II-fold pyridoxal phosphate-dependent enzyme [Polyangiaceae bacterium]